MVTAAALTQAVRRARIAVLGPLVSMNNPVRIAEEIAMLDQMSGGRLDILPLRGTPNEFPYYNVPAEETRERTQEAVLLIRKALTEPEPFSWKSTHYDFPVVSVWPGPTQAPHPPMFYSANSPESAAFAAEHHFGAAQSFAGPKLVADRMRFYREQCAAHGWTPAPDQMLVRSFCVVGENHAHALELMSRIQGGQPSDHIPKEVLPPQEAGGQQPGAAADPATDALYAFGALQFHGDSDQVAQQIRDYHKLTGVGVFDLSFSAGYYSQEETADQVRRFARQVIPQLRDLS
jgi:alkanesulfonate monooxygenase SsuD/methylene tetrahydromethanopterin reductase-like flavin-dependent oxidoreductase (luciferase family)